MISPGFVKDYFSRGREVNHKDLYTEDEGREPLAQCEETAGEMEGGRGLSITSSVWRLAVPPVNRNEKQANMKAVTLAKIPVGSFRVEAPVLKL